MIDQNGEKYIAANAFKAIFDESLLTGMAQRAYESGVSEDIIKATLDKTRAVAKIVIESVDAFPAAPVAIVVRCLKCKYAVPLDAHSDGVYGLHCSIGRGEEVRNVWHKYKKYYKDYSIVDADGFCDQGEAKQ